MDCYLCAADTANPVSGNSLCKRHREMQGMAAKVQKAKPKDQRSAALEFMRNLSKLPPAGGE